MSYEAKVVLDSIGPNGVRLATVRLCYPMKVHWDLMTHRVFSRNASSGRSISVTRMLKWLAKDHVKPLAWVGDAKSMQSGGLLHPVMAEVAEVIWEHAFRTACSAAEALERLGVHRQDVNSLLMPFGYINVLVTSTTFDNFLALRCDPAARPEMQKVGVMLGRAIQASTPTRLEAGEWHLPYVTDAEKREYPLEVQQKLSVARCGHLTNEADEKRECPLEKELARYERFLGECAWSTFEHQGQAHPAGWGDAHRSGNFVGWTQLRQTLAKSVHASFDYSTLDRFGEQGFIV